MTVSGSLTLKSTYHRINAYKVGFNNICLVHKLLSDLTKIASFVHRYICSTLGVHYED